MDAPPAPAFFFYSAPSPPATYTLSLHDALPIYRDRVPFRRDGGDDEHRQSISIPGAAGRAAVDRKSTRLNSSHITISYAVFCLKKKNTRSFSSTPFSSGST